MVQRALMVEMLYLVFGLANAFHTLDLAGEHTVNGADCYWQRRGYDWPPTRDWRLDEEAQTTPFLFSPSTMLSWPEGGRGEVRDRQQTVRAQRRGRRRR